MAAAVLVVVGLAGWQWGPAGYRHAEMLYWQRQCMAYARPPDFVVLDDDPARAAALLAADPQYRRGDQTMTPEPGLNGPFLLAEYRPDAIARFLPNEASGVAFMHARRSPGGQERLVIVSCGWAWAYYCGYSLGIDAGTVVVPGSWRSNPTVADRKGQVGSVSAEPNWRWTVGHDGGPREFRAGFRVFAGQPDPADPSHFTIAYERRKLTLEEVELGVIRWVDEDTARWERGTIDGWLRDDDTVEMRVRDGPLVESQY